MIAPDVGGGFGGKLQTTPEEFIAWAVARRLQQAGEVHRDPLRVAHVGPPRPRPVAEAHAVGGEGRHGHRVQGRAARRPRRVRLAGRRRRTGARRVHVQRDLQVPGVPLPGADGAHQQDLDRRLPRRRPARGDVRHRADDGRARGRGRGGPARDPREELDQARGVPVHDRGRAGVRLRQLRGGDRPGQGDVRVRRAARRAEAAPRRRRPGPARARRLDVHRDVRPRAVPGARLARLRGRRLGARERPDAADRQGRGASPVPPRTARGTRRRSARSWPTGSACAFEDVEVLHGDTQVARQGRTTPTARGRWSSAARRSSGPPTR